MKRILALLFAMSCGRSLDVGALDVVALDAGVTKQGTVSIYQSAYETAGGLSWGGGWYASFTTSITEADPNPNSCSTTTFGRCTAVRCVEPDGGYVQGATPTLIRDSAGVVTISGASTDVRLTPDAGIYAAGRLSMAQVWGDAATLTLAASGETVPAFSSKLTVPGNITVTAPVCGRPPTESAFTCGTLNRASPLSIMWSGGTVGSVVVVLTSTGAHSTGIVSCSFAAEAGTGTIPTQMLSQLDTMQGSLSITSENETNFAAGDYAVRFRATGAGGVAGSLALE